MRNIKFRVWDNELKKFRNPDGKIMHECSVKEKDQ